MTNYITEEEKKQLPIVLNLFGDLKEAYLALTTNPRDPNTKSLIRGYKIQAKKDGLSNNYISSLDEIARDSVEYTGRKIV